MSADPTRALAAHWRARRDIPIARLFADDRRRFQNCSVTLGDLLLDYSKTSIDAEALSLLTEWATVADVVGARDNLFAGELVNRSEARAALHPALRAPVEKPPSGLSADIFNDIIGVREQMLEFAEDCRNGKITAADGEPFTDIINIGIGGSDLGAAMAVAALKPYHGKLRIHFVANIDGAALADTLAGLDARRTLIIISSKSFTTLETMENAERARQWLADAVAEESRHIVGLTAAPEKAQAFGCGRVFRFWDWVGGRYSLWGAVGLPLALAIGRQNFNQFLAGAHAMDEHFCNAPLGQNMPVLFGLIGVWHRTICGYPTLAVVPYAERLYLLPSYLQQLGMESNGKSVRQDGGQTDAATAPVIWGSVGSNAQHAYFQMLHQGGDIVPCEFIAVARGSAPDDGERQHWLVANCLAQSEALMDGASSPLPHKNFVGNRPSVTLFFRQLTPFALGRLLALYEHRIFVEATLWGINPFDQWGVELGKALAQQIHARMNDNDGESNASTQGLMEHYRNMAKQEQSDE